jgi:hypothetical protein
LYGQLYYCLGVAELKLEAFEKSVVALCEAQKLLPQDQVVEEMLQSAREAHREKLGRDAEPCRSN